MHTNGTPIESSQQRPDHDVQSQRHPTRREVWIAEDSVVEVPPSPAQMSADVNAPHPKGSKRSRPKARRPIAVSAADDTILRALYTYQFLTADQIRRLCHYRPGTLDAVRKRLKEWVQVELVMRVRLPRASAGNAPWVYGLDKAGLAYLAASGSTDATDMGIGRFRASEQYERSYLFLSHLMATNDFLIAAALLGYQVPEVVLAGMRHEHALRRTPIRVTIGPGQEQLVIPDGWLDFHIRGAERLCVVLELDRATEEERAFKRKVRGLLAYAAGPYQQAFGTESLTVAIATTGGERRVERMRVWCEQVLREQQHERDADLFFLTALPSGELDPKALFLSPLWSRPFATDRVPLIEL